MTENAFSLQDTDVMFAPNLCIRNVSPYWPNAGAHRCLNCLLDLLCIREWVRFHWWKRITMLLLPPPMLLQLLLPMLTMWIPILRSIPGETIFFFLAIFISVWFTLSLKHLRKVTWICWLWALKHVLENRILDWQFTFPIPNLNWSHLYRRILLFPDSVSFTFLGKMYSLSFMFFKK